ncbi:MAG: DMT family transporter [Pseudomonadota bacterium]
MTDAVKGWLYGIAATFVGGLYTVYAQQAGRMGLDPLDLVAFRYAIAFVLMLPVFLKVAGRQNFAGLGLRRALILSAVGGLGFVVFFFSGFVFAPLSHGAVLPPGASAVTGAVLAFFFRGEGFGKARIITLVLILSGLILVSGASFFGANSGTWRGDILFMLAGADWALFLVLLARWKVASLSATAIVSVITCIVFLPYYLITGGYSNLAEVAPADILIQVVIQGFFAGFGGLYLFAKSASYLSVAAASALPGLMPVQALLLGALLFGLIPAPIALAGAALVIAGQWVGMGAKRST